MTVHRIHDRVHVELAEEPAKGYLLGRRQLLIANEDHSIVEETLPAWLVLGVPGALLAWTYRPGKREPIFRKH